MKMDVIHPTSRLTGKTGGIVILDVTIITT